MLLSSLLINPIYADGLSKGLQGAAGRDTVFNVWVFFKDRPGRSGAEQVSERAALRRAAANFKSGENDRPVERGYISEIERRGGSLRHTFAWGNAASFSVHSSRLNEIAALPFVKSVSPVGVYVRRDADDVRGLGRSAAVIYDGYGWHLDMVNIPMAHAYLRVRERGKRGDPGHGVLMAFFDSGFRLMEHRAFSHVRDSGSVRYAYDFVDGDTLVYDPDSVVNNPRHPNHLGDRHGTQTLAVVAAHHPGVYMGAAWGANFALARTEDIAIEARVEEDNWAAAVMWADSLGADIISSSLGYRSGFDDPKEDYEYKHMDGMTTIVSIAAAEAVRRGIVVVNSMGNYGRDVNGRIVEGSISAPADVDGVVAVGAVDRNRVLASFSSRGPTFDRRIKPDVVAPGVSVQVPDPYSHYTGAYTHSSGTSFSAPITAGILALILQAHNGINAEEARERLYRSCVFAPRQSQFDNNFGRGIPNALHAVMRDNEIFVKITDTYGRPLTGGTVTAGGKTHTLDSTGYLLTEIPLTSLPAKLKISFRGSDIDSLTVNTLPFSDNLVLQVQRSDELIIRPTIVKKNNIVRGRYLFSGIDFPAQATVAIYTLHGKRVWKQDLPVHDDGSAEFVWDRGRGSGGGRAAAGTYLVMVRHGNHVISSRVVVGN